MNATLTSTIAFAFILLTLAVGYRWHRRAAVSSGWEHRSATEWDPDATPIADEAIAALRRRAEFVAEHGDDLLGGRAS